jgi:site-specific recombinase XerC
LAVACSSVNQTLCADLFTHRASERALDRQLPVIGAMWHGISRSTLTASLRKTWPITSLELRSMLDGLAHAARQRLADVGDGASLALGWLVALRLSELVGLDCKQVATAIGSLRKGEPVRVMTLVISE